MKKTTRIIPVLFLVMLLSAGFVSAVSADDMEPWEEEFLDKYGEYWMYEEYGTVWFDYYFYEGEEDIYNDLLLKYQNLWDLYNRFSNTSAPLEFWEAEFLLEYGTPEMYETYGEYWYDYFLYGEECNAERYAELSRMYKELSAEHEKPAVSDNPIQNVTNTTALNTTNTSVLNPTNTSTLNTTNTSVLNPVNTTTQNTTTSTPVTNVTEKPEQNTSVTPGPEPETGAPIIPVIIVVVVVLVAAGIAILVIQKRAASDAGKVSAPAPAEEPAAEEKPAPAVVSEEEKQPAEVPVVKPKADLPLTTPKECYAAVLEHLEDKYGIQHGTALTPRQLLTFGEPTAELKEFIRFYEQVRYAPKTEAEDTAKLAELARVILKQ